mmetsp:Transcript_26394/g.48056  ORF Transcript_26394/g.48056 Transcript_26394/m.48056 type:complete len:157 (+) Transcript_26394:1810-2280(+)
MSLKVCHVRVCHTCNFRSLNLGCGRCSPESMMEGLALHVAAPSLQRQRRRPRHFATSGRERKEPLMNSVRLACQACGLPPGLPKERTWRLILPAGRTISCRWTSVPWQLLERAGAGIAQEVQRVSTGYPQEHELWNQGLRPRTVRPRLFVYGSGQH